MLQLLLCVILCFMFLPEGIGVVTGEREGGP